MLVRFSFVLSCLVLACAPSVAPPLPDSVQRGPSVLVGRREAVVVFPEDSTEDFPWQAVRLPDRFAGPFWNFLAVGRGMEPIAAAARVEVGDSLDLPAFPSLAAVIARAGLYDCDLDRHVIVCWRSLGGSLKVQGQSLVLRITDNRWVGTLNKVRPDSAWLRVDRPLRRTIRLERVPIQYVDKAWLSFQVLGVDLDVVPVIAPDSTPAWFHSDSSYAVSTLKGIAVVEFGRGTSQALRQAAVDSVQGTAVGGIAGESGFEGVYFIRVPTGSDLDGLLAALLVLRRQPQVLLADLYVRGEGYHRRTVVPAVAPDSQPAWFGHDSSWVSDRSSLKRIVDVRFEPGATPLQKSAAIDSVGGSVVGGYHLGNDPEGVYYILVPNASTDTAMLAAIRILKRQGVVKSARWHGQLKPEGLRPAEA